MSYVSSPDPRPANSHRDVLNDSQWRMRHSAWLLAPILGFGAFGCVGFLYIAFRTGRRKLWIIAAVYSALSVIALTASTIADGKAGPLYTFAGGLLVALWLGGTIHGLFLNREYLRWRATSRPWYAAGTATTLPSAPAPSFAPQQSTAPLHSLGVDHQQYYAPTPAPAPATRPQTNIPAAPAPAVPIDVNLAEAATLAQIPGLDPQWANHIVAVRATRNGFTGLADFTDAVGIQPHHLMRVRDHITFSPVRATETPHQQRSTRGTHR